LIESAHRGKPGLNGVKDLSNPLLLLAPFSEIRDGLKIGEVFSGKGFAKRVNCPEQAMVERFLKIRAGCISFLQAVHQLAMQFIGTDAQNNLLKERPN